MCRFKRDILSEDEWEDKRISQWKEFFLHFSSTQNKHWTPHAGIRSARHPPTYVWVMYYGYIGSSASSCTPDRNPYKSEQAKSFGEQQQRKKLNKSHSMCTSSSTISKAAFARSRVARIVFFYLFWFFFSSPIGFITDSYGRAWHPAYYLLCLQFLIHRSCFICAFKFQFQFPFQRSLYFTLGL